MIRHAAIFLILLCASGAGAANHYIRQLSTGTGNNTGVDWNNPITNWTGLSGTWTRGDTYYFAGGDYRPTRTGLGGWRLDAADSGSTVTTVKVAMITDHGTDTGWNPAWNNDIIHIYNVTIDTDNWNINGQVGQWATNDADYIPFRLLCHDTNNSTGALDNFMLNNGNGNITNITVQHMYIFDDNLKSSTNPPWVPGYVGYYMRGFPRFVTNNYITIDYVSSTCLQYTADYSLNTNCVFARNGIGQIAMNFVPTDHAEPVSVANNAGALNTAFLNCRFQDARSSAWLFCNLAWSNGIVGGCTFRTTGFWNVGVEVSSTTALFGGNDSHLTDFLTVEQCSFVNIPYAGRFGENGTLYGPNCVSRNNIFYNVTNTINGVTMPYGPTMQHHHNLYGLSGTYSETGEQDSNVNLFTHTNTPNTDLTLTADTATSDTSIYPLYFTDVKGNVWTTSRGAIQFSGSPPPPAGTLLPLNVRIFGQ